MRKPKVVVYVENGGQPIRQEAASALRCLRHRFSVVVVREAAAFERRAREGARFAVIIRNSLPESLLPKLRSLARWVPLILFVPQDARVEIDRLDLPTDHVRCFDPEKAARLLPREAALALTDDLLARCRAAVSSFGRLVNHDEFADVLKRAFALHPTKPFPSVEDAARWAERTHRWLNREWRRLSTGDEVPYPALTDIFSAIVFLRILQFWLKGIPAWRCARILGVGEERLSGAFHRFAEKNPSEVRVSTCAGIVLRIEVEVFDWLLRSRSVEKHHEER